MTMKKVLFYVLLGALSLSTVTTMVVVTKVSKRVSALDGRITQVEAKVEGTKQVTGVLLQLNCPELGGVWQDGACVIYAKQ